MRSGEPAFSPLNAGFPAPPIADNACTACHVIVSRQLAEPHLSYEFPDPLRARMTGNREESRAQAKESLLSALRSLKMDTGPSVSGRTQGSRRR
jgi:hypothetical protein